MTSNEIHAVRPWGEWLTLEEAPNYKIKKITVSPGHRLSLQSHNHRSEHWVVVSGTAKIICNGVEATLHVNQSTYIPAGATHRLENPGKIPLVIIEVQNGEYLGEDDIMRYEDDYHRADEANNADK